MFKKLQQNYPNELFTIDEFCLLVVKNKSIEELDIGLKKLDVIEQLKNLNDQEKTLCLGLLDALNIGVQNSKHIYFAAPYYKSGEPYKLPANDVYDLSYKAAELIDYILSQYGEFPFPTPSWINEYISSKEFSTAKVIDTRSITNDLDVKIYPKLIQLPIMLHQQASKLEYYDNNSLTPIFLDIAKELGFPTEEYPTLKTDKYGKHELNWPKFKNYNDKQLTSKVFDVILKQVK